MTIEFWLVISAGATFLLALAAFFNIWRDIRIRKKEAKLRVIDEIIAWIKRGTNIFADYTLMKHPFESQAAAQGLQILWSEQHIMRMIAEEFGNEFAKEVQIASDLCDKLFKQICEDKDISIIQECANECNTRFNWLLAYANAVKYDLET